MGISDIIGRAKMRLYKQRVKMSIKSGVRPITLRYKQVNACDTSLPIAYRTETYIRSNALGVLRPCEYKDSCDGTMSGVRIAEWSVIEAMSHINSFVKSGRNLEWISVECPSDLALRVDVYSWLKELIRKYDFKYPEKLCLEFPVTLLSERTDITRTAVLDTKLLGVKTMLRDCGGDACPTSRLVQIPVDMVLLTHEMTELTGNRNKPDVVPTFVSYLRSMRVEVYADGVVNDEQISTLNRYDCVGYTIGKNYCGKKALPFGRNIRFETALAQKDTEDDFVL